MGAGSVIGRTPDQLPAQRPNVKNLQHRDEDDAERRRGVGHHRDFANADGHENERDDRADEADIEPGVEQMVFVFEQPQFQSRLHGLAPDFGELGQAPDVDERLDGEERHQGNDAELVHI